MIGYQRIAFEDKKLFVVGKILILNQKEIAKIINNDNDYCEIINVQGTIR